MNVKGVFKALFLMPARRQEFRVRCVTHDEVFTEPMEMSFHETMNLNCGWKKLEPERPSPSQVDLEGLSKT